MIGVVKMPPAWRASVREQNIKKSKYDRGQHSPSFKQYNLVPLFQTWHNSHLKFCETRWSRDAAASASFKFDHISTKSLFIEKGNLKLFAKSAATANTKTVSESHRCKGCKCLRPFRGSSLEILHIFPKTWWRKVWTPLLNTRKRDSEEILSSNPQKFLRWSKRYLKESFNAAIRWEADTVPRRISNRSPEEKKKRCKVGAYGCRGFASSKKIGKVLTK